MGNLVKKIASTLLNIQANVNIGIFSFLMVGSFLFRIDYEFSQEDFIPSVPKVQLQKW